MTALRFSLTAAVAFGLSACAPSSGEDGGGQGVPPGFELAMAQEANDASVRQEQDPQIIDLSVEELQQLRDAGNIWLIDVRTDEEVAEGMIAGADHIPLAEFAPDPGMIAQANGREIVLYCRSGRRSAIVGRKLADFLDKPVRHLEGGFVAWDASSGAVQ